MTVEFSGSSHLDGVWGARGVIRDVCEGNGESTVGQRSQTAM